MRLGTTRKEIDSKMKLQKVVAFAIASAAVLVSGASSATGTQNLWSLTPAASKVATNNSIDIKINGTGKCGLNEKLINPDGTVAYDKMYGQSIEAHSFPNTAVVVPKQAGTSKWILYTVAHPQAVNCPAGQQISIDIVAFQEPVCPTGWQRTSFDKNTGVMACVPKTPQLTCTGKTQSFVSIAPPSTCQAGCENVVY